MHLVKILFTFYLLFISCFEANAFTLLSNKRHCNGPSWWSAGDPTEELRGDVTPIYDVNSSSPGISFADWVSCRVKVFSVGSNGDFVNNGIGSLTDSGYAANAKSTRITGKLIRGVVLSNGVKTRDIACLYSDVSYANNRNAPDNGTSYNPFFAHDALYPLLVPSSSTTGYDFTFAQRSETNDWSEVTFSYVNSSRLENNSYYETPIPRDINNITIANPSNRLAYIIPASSKAKLPYKCEDMFGTAACNSNDIKEPWVPLYMFSSIPPGQLNNIKQLFVNKNHGPTTEFVDSVGLYPGSTDTGATRYPQIPMLVSRCSAANPFKVQVTVGSGRSASTMQACYACVILPPGPNPPPMCDPMIIQKSIPELINLCSYGDYIDSSNLYYQAAYIPSNINNQCDAPVVGNNLLSKYGYGKQGLRMVFDNLDSSTAAVSAVSSDHFYADSYTGKAFANNLGVRTGPYSGSQGKTIGYRMLYTNARNISASVTPNNTMSYFGSQSTVSGVDDSNYIDILVDFSGYGSGLTTAGAAKNPAVNLVGSYSSNGSFNTIPCLSSSNGSCVFQVQDPDANIRKFSVAYEIDNTNPLYTPSNKSICLSELSPATGATASQITCMPRSTPGKPFVRLCNNNNCSASNPGIQWAFEPFNTNPSEVATVTMNDVLNNVAYDNSCNANASGAATQYSSTYPYVYDVSYSAYFLDTNLVEVPLARTSIKNSSSAPLLSGDLVNESGCNILYNYNTTSKFTVTNSCNISSNFQGSGTVLGATSFDSVNANGRGAQSAPATYISKFSTTTKYNSPVKATETNNLVCILNTALSNDGTSSSGAASQMLYYFYQRQNITNPAFMCLRGANISEYVLANIVDATGTPVQYSSGTDCSALLSGNNKISTNINDVVPEFDSRGNNIVSIVRGASYNSNQPIKVNGNTRSQINYIGPDPSNQRCVAARLKTDLEAGLCVELDYSCPAIAFDATVGGNYANWPQTESGSTALPSVSSAQGGCQFSNPSNPNAPKPSRLCLHGYWEPVSYNLTATSDKLERQFCPFAQPCPANVESSAFICGTNSTTAGYQASCSCKYGSSSSSNTFTLQCNPGTAPSYESSWSALPQGVSCPSAPCPATTGQANEAYAVCPATNVGSVAACTCASGSSQSVSRSCGASSGSSGTSNPVWSAPNPSCMPSCPATTGQASDSYAICPVTNVGSVASCNCLNSSTKVQRTCNLSQSSGASGLINTGVWAASTTSCPEPTTCPVINGNDPNNPGLVCTSSANAGATASCSCLDGYVNSVTPSSSAITFQCSTNGQWFNRFAKCVKICRQSDPSFRVGTFSDTTLVCNPTFVGTTNSTVSPNTQNNCSCSRINNNYTNNYVLFKRECKSDGTWGDIFVKLSVSTTGSNGVFYPQGSWVPSGDVCSPTQHK